MLSFQLYVEDDNLGALNFYARKPNVFTDQSEGVLMERFQITADQAFVILARANSETNTKLHDVADHLEASGELPGQKSNR